MNRTHWNTLFLLLGLAVIVWMLFTFEMDWQEIWFNIQKAGYWFLAIIGVWVLIYLFNTLSWYQIICGDDKGRKPVNFWRVYKLSISGFALNYATPFGLMGGEPYRIMEITPYLGIERATSSVILYVMMHIFSHICFWLVSVALFIMLYPLSWAMWLMMLLIVVFCITAIYFFMNGYRNGMIINILTFIGHSPIGGKSIRRFLENKRQVLLRIDNQIAALHGQRCSTFWKAFFFEFISRVMTSLEIYFILNTQIAHPSFFDAVLIMAFTSLFSNIFFFSPMQLGAREGGFALAVSGLMLSSGLGVYVSLLSRLRELFWIAVGVCLMKIAPAKGGKT